MTTVRIEIRKGFAYAVVEHGDFREDIKVAGSATFATELGLAIIRALQINTEEQVT